MPRPITTSKLIALALCLFVLAAVADRIPDPPATHHLGPIQLSATHSHAGSQAPSLQAFSCTLPVGAQPEHLRTLMQLEAAQCAAPGWFAAAPFSTRAPPRFC